jgi:hypothetical protein
MAFKFCRDDATRESYVAALFDCLECANYSICYFLNSHKQLPMGLIDLYFVDNEVEVRCRLKVVVCVYITCQPVGSLPLGAPSVLLMQVAPEAMGGYL